MKNSVKPKQPKRRRLDKAEPVATAAEMTGAAVGGIVGSIGGPLPGAAGSVLGYVIGRIGRDFLSKALSEREKSRVEVVLSLAGAEIAKRRDRGESIRSDGLFSEGSAGGKGTELAEAVMIKAQREPDTDKLPYLANLLVSIAFDSSIGPAYAHQLLRQAEDLTYRQFVLMHLCANKEHYRLKETDHVRLGEVSSPLVEELLREVLDLCDRGLVAVGSEHMISVEYIAPSRMLLPPFGLRAYNALGLSTIPKHHAVAVAAPLEE